MMEIARAAYLDEVLFAKRDSKERFEIQSFIELSLRMNADDLGVHVNKHLAKRMFLVGLTISAADIICHLVLAESFREMMDFQKIGANHAFRWLDHMQHLPGLQDQVESLGLFVSFPDETQATPSKA